MAAAADTSVEAGTAEGVAEEWEQLGRALKGASEHAVKHTRVSAMRLTLLSAEMCVWRSMDHRLTPARGESPLQDMAAAATPVVSEAIFAAPDVAKGVSAEVLRQVATERIRRARLCDVVMLRWSEWRVQGGDVAKQNESQL